MKKLSVLLLLLLAGSMIFAGAGAEQGATVDDYPNKPIRLLVGVAPGGAQEAAIRRWQPYAEEALGVPISLEFMPGAGAIIATNVLRNATPDGYTIQQEGDSSHIIAELLLGADWTTDDFDYLTRWTNDPGSFFVRKDAPYNNLNEFVEYARKQPPNSLAVSLASASDVGILAVRLLNEAYGIQLNPVGYDGGGPARLAVLRGEVAASISNYFGAAAIWSESKVLAIHQSQNTVPALQAAGVKTANELSGKTMPDITTRYIIFAPKVFSQQYPARAKKLTDALKTAWSNPEFLKGIKDSGMDGYIQVTDAQTTLTDMKKLEATLKGLAHYFDM